MGAWSILFLLLTLLFAALGLSATGAGPAVFGMKLLFVSFAVLFVASLLVRIVGRV